VIRNNNVPWLPARLFTEVDLYSFIQELYLRIENDVLGLEPNHMLSTPEGDLVSYFVQTYTKIVPILRDDLREIAAHGETQVGVPDTDGRVWLPANFYIFAIPYEGDPEFFRVMPKLSPINPPVAVVLPGEIRVKLGLLDTQGESVLSNDLKEIIGRMKTYLGSIREEMEAFYRELPRKLSELICAQKAKFLRNQKILAALDIPIRQREDVPQVIPLSVTKRVPKAILPSASKEPFKPEPGLPEESYDMVLQALQNMTVTMERSPSVFLRAKEEEIRDILLVSLNGIFDGGASGETFSATGKTDIHILCNGKSIFIAELKFWNGPKSLTDALDQLLSYLTWRHTKTALIILNRNQDFSRVLDHIRVTAKEHLWFKRSLEPDQETTFRFIFRSPSDANREVFVTILAFDLPKAAEKGSCGASDPDRGPE
jgi:hypothetical protein